MRKKRIILIGYKIGSRSLKNLQTQLKEDQNVRNVLRVRRTSVRYRRRPSDSIIAWGPASPSVHTNVQQEIAKKIASNKLHSFLAFKEHGVCTPEWTTNPTDAVAWNKPYMARTLLRSHSGRGIVMVEAGQQPPPAKLYVQYKKKKHEYRVHVFNGNVIDVTQKKRRAGFEGRDNQIRNHQNGWVYCRENITEPAGIQSLAVAACNALGLLSGAVDIIWNELENKCYVLEINTAPGIEGTTCQKYTTSILESLA
jgi:glutathione synthase/RimK-type ligase-like ATP-grasp enzyme